MSETVAIRAVVITLSDSGHAGLRDDESGAVLEGLLNELGAEYVERVLLPDEVLLLSEKLIYYADRTPANLILTTGGTGLTSRDVTPEATQGGARPRGAGFCRGHAGGVACKDAARHALAGRERAARHHPDHQLPRQPERPAEEQFAVIRDALPHALEKLADLGGDCARSTSSGRRRPAARTGAQRSRAS